MNIPFDIITTLVTGCYGAFCAVVVVSLLIETTLSTTIKRFCCKMFVSKRHCLPHQNLIFDVVDNHKPQTSNCFDSAPKIITLPILCTLAFSIGIFAETTSKTLPGIEPLRRSARMLSYEGYCARLKQQQKHSAICSHATPSIAQDDTCNIPKDLIPRLFFNAKNKTCRNQYYEATGAFYKASNQVKQDPIYFAILSKMEIHVNFTKAIIAISGMSGMLLFALIPFGAVTGPRFLSVHLSPTVKVPISLLRLFVGGVALWFIVFLMLKPLAQKEQAYYDSTFGFFQAVVSPVITQDQILTPKTSQKTPHWQESQKANQGHNQHQNNVQ